MESITSLRECILADEIGRIEFLSKEMLMQELIDMTAEKLESLSLNELTTYQQDKHEKRRK
jgi:nucleoside-triphosphatase THEP1